MSSKKPTDLNLALTAMRSALNWNQAELARAAGLPPNAVSDFERGNRAFSVDKLEELAGVMGLSAEAVTQARSFVRSMGRQARAPGYPDEAAESDRRHVERLAVQAGNAVTDFARTLLSSFTAEGRALAFRQQARGLWQRLQKRTLAERRSLVEEDPEFRSWALCELICKESIKAAADNADRARELADLALLIADLAPCEASWRQRLQGYAWAHVSNARRVRGDLPGAEEAIVRADELWKSGAPGDPGLLDEAQVVSLKASLRTNQGRLMEAEALLDQALMSASPDLRPNFLLQRARLLEWAGSYERALMVLSEAAPMITLQGDQRSLSTLHHNCAWNLTHLERYEEAEALLPEIRALAFRLTNELDTLRLRWLEGRVSAGLGRIEDAIIALSQVRIEFAARGIAYDAALATLELAALQLGRERTWEVKLLARQMAPIFQVQGVHREALAALKLFCEAAERESATVELARRIAEYLYLAQHNSALRFEELSESNGPE
ncbi:MAG TPA: helix-turn-helix domain-containing protein [Thermoanaerobaculia bacterium]|jgi:transcriptional regulator with XRE-family HTH domain|nr:helix-turn-helix domain-containing protein [Thermoanaerobaculia bacterium]